MRPSPLSLLPEEFLKRILADLVAKKHCDGTVKRYWTSSTNDSTARGKHKDMYISVCITPSTIVVICHQTTSGLYGNKADM